MCGSRQVKKLLSAPRLNLSHGSPSVDEAAGARGEKAARSGPVTAEIRELQGQLMRGLRKLIDATEDVGDRVAEEARRIHFDEAPDRPIRGVATPEETRALHEEGIEVLTLPLPPALKGRLQ